MAILTICLNPTLQKTLHYTTIIPGEVNRAADHRLDVSGKGVNVTRVLNQLGKDAVHLTQLGGVMRQLFLALCEQDNLKVEWVESNSQIRFCYTILNDKEKTVTELVEESDPVSEGTDARLLEKFDSLLESKKFTGLIVSGTKADGFSDNTIPEITRKAKEKGLFVILDIKGKDLIESLQYKPDIIKPNLSEFSETFGIAEITQLTAHELLLMEKIKSTMLDINQKYGSRIILTNGRRLINVVDDNKHYQIEIKPAKRVNTTGCGDAFAAGLIFALENGVGFHDAINEGIRCGGLNAELIRPGVIR